MNAKQKCIAALVSAMFAGSVWAAPAADSPYFTDPSNEYVQDATSDGIGNVNMVLCIMNAMKPAAMVNAGPYLALVDKNKCDTSKRASADNSSGGASGATAAADYMNAVVTVIQPTSADPMVAKVWMTMTENGQTQDIDVLISAAQSPTDVPPYGRFRLDYIGKVGSTPQMNGYIDTMTTGVLKYMESGTNSNNIALALNASSTTSGAGSMSIAPNWAPSQAFDFAYNPDYFRRSDGTSDQCFDRLKAHASRSVWQYGTYKESDGTRVDVANPGFPVMATYSGSSHYGYANYYGINFQGLDLSAVADSAAIPGLVVTDQRPNISTTYDLGKVGGKLTKWDRNQTTLADMDGVPFTFNGDLSGRTTGNAAVVSFGNWQMVWNNTTGQFSVVGQQACGPNGCVVSAINPPAIVDGSAVVNGIAFNNMPMMGWSDSFGGNLNIPSTGSAHTGTDAVYYYTQSLVIPGSSSLTLYCLSQCPTKNSVNGANAYVSGTAPSPFGANTGQQWFSAASANNTVTYTFDAGGLEHTPAGGTKAAIVLNNAAYFSANQQFNNGIMTGRLFLQSLTNANCPAGMPGGSVCEPANPTTYYTWQTGLQPWAQSLWLTNTATSTVVAFDPPQNILYTVASADDPSGAWVGKNIQLQFNGFGNLFGIPGNCVSPVDNSPADCGTTKSRYVPSFALADGDSMTLGSTRILVKGLNAELRFAKVSLATCSGAGLTLSPQTVPTSGLVDTSSVIGTKPTNLINSGLPKVVDGVIQ